MTHKSIPLKNKSILLIIIILLLSKSNVFSQNLAIKFEADSTLQKGDTALIKIKDEIRGTIQWQQSYEKENWEDIDGETSTELLREINDTTFFRVKITEESCELPFYSDVVKINTMKVSPKTVIIDTNKTYLVSDTQELENDIYKYLGDTDIEVTENSVLVGYKYNGYVKIVDAISYSGDTLVLNTHSGRISDIFEYYNVEDSVHLLLSDEDVKKSGIKGKIIKGKTVYQKQGVSLKKEGSGLNLSDVVLFDGTVENVDLQIIITNGEVNFKPAFSSYFDIKFLSVDYIRLIAEGALDMNMDVSVNASSSIEFGDEITLFSISYPFAIGPVPVNIKVSFMAGFTTDLTVSGTFSTGFETTQNLAFGASYDKNTNPNWDAIWNRNGTFNEHPLEMSNESGEVNAKVYVKPAISFNVGWDPFSKKSEENEDSEEIDSTNKYLTQDTIAVKTENAEKLFEFGPYLAVSSYLRYNSIIDFNGWEYGIYGGAEGELGFNVSFFGYNIADFNTTLASWEKDIITGTSPVADFSSDSTNISPGSTVQFADESTGEPESWYWDFGDGETSTEQNPSHVYENVGNYDVSLTVEGSFGSNTETKTDYIRVESGDNVGTINYLSISGNIDISDLSLFDSEVTTVSTSSYGTNFDGFNTFETQNGLYGVWHLFRSFDVISGKLKFNQNSGNWESSTDTDVSTIYAPSSNQFLNFFNWNGNLYQLGCSATSGTIYSRVYDVSSSSWVSFSPSMDGVYRFQTRPSVYIDASNTLHGVFNYVTGSVYPQGLGTFYFDSSASPNWQRTGEGTHEYLSTLQTGIEGKWLFFWKDETTHYIDEYNPTTNTIVNRLTFTINDLNGYGEQNISDGTLFKQNNEVYLSFAYTPSGNFKTNGSPVNLGIMKIAELTK